MPFRTPNDDQTQSLGRGQVSPTSPRANLQYELGVTASVLQDAQTRLELERQQVDIARAGEAQALEMVRLARADARMKVEERMGEEQALAKVMVKERKTLEEQIVRLESDKKGSARHAQAEITELKRKLTEATENLAEARELKFASEAKLNDERKKNKQTVQALEAKLAAAHEETKAARKDGRMEISQAMLDADKEAKALQAKLAAEKEKQIEHTKSMAVRRIAKKGLAMGWNTWLEQYRLQRRTTRMLKAAGASDEIIAAATPAIEAAQDNPELLQAILEQFKAALGNQ